MSVDIAVIDHKHQDLSLDDQEKGLSKMSIDICKSIFRKLATNGRILILKPSINKAYFSFLSFIKTPQQ